jgi:hypothetical protein
MIHRLARVGLSAAENTSHRPSGEMATCGASVIESGPGIRVFFVSVC